MDARVTDDQSLPVKADGMHPAEGEREAIVTRLSDAYASDRISIEDFEHRVEAVYRAASRADLMALVADLPPDASSGASLSVAVAPSRMVAMFSSVERRGALRVPQKLEVRAVFGNVELDFTNAQFSPGLTEISIRSVFGNVEMQLPPNVQVENHGGALFGNFECHGREPSAQPAGAPTVTVRITGRTVLGNVEINNQRERH